MTLACWLGLCLVAQSAAASPPAADVAAAYREAKARAGRDPDALVRLALWCEQNGLTAERLKSLSLAILYRPDHEAARGLLGLVNYRGKWKRPDDVRAAEEADPEARKLQQEYLARRARARPTADSQQELARWCEQNGLADQAAVHYRQVVRLAPERPAAWKKLGYVKSGKGWARPAEIAEAKAEAEAQSRADRAWRPKLEKYRDDLIGKDAAKRRRAEEALASITDPRAVPMIWAVLVRPDAATQLRAADAMAQIQGPAASNALAMLAVSSEFPDVRGRATQILSRRDPREFVEPLLERVHRPFKVTVSSDVSLGSYGQVFAEGERYNLRRTYQVDAERTLARIPSRLFADGMPFLGGMDPQSAAIMNSLAGSSWSRGGAIDVQRMAMQRDLDIASFWSRIDSNVQLARARMAEDVAGLEAANREIRAANDRVLPLLKLSTGRDFGEDQDSWMRWWSDQLGAVYSSSTPAEKPTYSDFVSIQTEPPHTGCFVAGTLVNTARGPEPIETLQVGDRVLSQDTTTGQLSYRAVTATHENGPMPTLRLTLGTEPIVATGIHRFWRPGKGWTMARDLKPGDLVRTLGGTSRLSAVEPGPVALVYNLDVAENRDFFVGKGGYLVYDFSLVCPATTPFDAAPASVATAP
ncbi:hypothetical protein OJF2_66380 [Aquisphaera giovannonii]|uniref:Hint domain-containing protein n=1 Tax=Aquisphaera giovannonii TaxID=406548 RepID=A0A5B9WBU1_9BACT|nr:polymorphic toxin-type HINT domain-containing protein [Aquisphaera giovannonii]QEH38042.1 hypothetical protein OJF2_66380 [Aquisphaera giovannonii]